MANAKHLAKLQEGVKAWNRWIGKNAGWPDLTRADLSGADLVDGDFFGVDFAKANLSAANLTRADLRQTTFHETNLRGADLREADLRGAEGYGADLRGADLREADLRAVDLGGADLSGADLRNTDLSDAIFRAANLKHARAGWTIFGNVDLSKVKGLEAMQHLGPSTIGIDTIYKSEGNVSPVFLRGAGVPETFITYARSLVGKTVEFYSCFISYSSQDQAMAERLHADLRAKDLRVWFAPEHLKIGDRFQDRIEESIRLYDKVMIVLSEDSVKSRWVEREVNAAREREDRENRTVLFPIRIDDAVMDAITPWAADLRRTRYIGDFTNWKDHDSYQKAFQRLLRDLRADTANEKAREAVKITLLSNTVQENPLFVEGSLSTAGEWF